MKFVKESDKDNTRERIVGEGAETPLAQESNNQESSRPDSSDSSTAATAVDAPPPARKRNLDSILKQSLGSDLPMSAHTLKTPDKRAKNELEGYFRTQLQVVEGNPLQWWKAEENNYFLLAALAGKYLCICAGSSPSE